MANEMATVMTHNNGYDCVLLVNERNEVVSRWDVDDEILADFLRDGSQPEKWETNEWPSGFDPEMQDDEADQAELRTIEAYGEECGRNGIINSTERKEFYKLQG